MVIVQTAAIDEAVRGFQRLITYEERCKRRTEIGNGK